MLRRILHAPVYEAALRTPLHLASKLSHRLERHVWLKREDLQPIHSFKLRGAYARIATLHREQQQAGVVAASAGNHAQGVALSAAKLNVAAHIVMPTTTPLIKVEAVERLGANIYLHGDDYDAACHMARRMARQLQATFIHPFDDLDVIAGQGTIAMEILDQAEAMPDAIFVPVGGGGLIAGIASYVKATSPHTRVIGVESDDAASMKAALLAGQPVDIGQTGIFADGVAVRKVGKNPFRLVRRYVDELITVSADQMCAAVRDIFEDTRSLVEPAGALAVAGLKRYCEQNAEGMNLVAINSGANVNFDRLSYVVERADIGEGQEMLLAVSIPERKGSFLKFCRALGALAITEFNYRYGDSDRAEVFVGLRVGRAPNRSEEILSGLKQAGYGYVDLSANELARSHVRHMVGGRCQQSTQERLIRFEFPERPGALLEFLTKLNGQWNISLFHYRNHGAARGRVLAGFEVPKQSEPEFENFLNHLGLVWVEESENPVYPAFLGTSCLGSTKSLQSA